MLVYEVHQVEGKSKSKASGGPQVSSCRTTKGVDKEEGREVGAIPTIPAAVLLG